MDNEEQRRVKQKYLLENIPAAGLDKDDFASFLLSLRPAGNQIEAWTLKELQYWVDKYVHLPHVRRAETGVPVVASRPPSSFEISLQGEQPLLRTTTQLQWISTTLNYEYPSAMILHPISLRDGKHAALIEQLTAYFIAHLQSYRGTLDSEAVTAFFTYSKEKLDRFMKSYTPRRSPFATLSKSFFLEVLCRRPLAEGQGFYAPAGDFDSGVKCLEECAEVLSILQKFSQKMGKFSRELTEALSHLSHIWTSFEESLTAVQRHLSRFFEGANRFQHCKAPPSIGAMSELFKKLGRACSPPSQLTSATCFAEQLSQRLKQFSEVN